MRLLIVNTLPESDEGALSAIRTLRAGVEECRVIQACEINFRPCGGCNACWLVTPGVCSIRDGYEELLKAYLESNAAVFLSGTALNFVDHRMKNIIDRLLPLAAMYIHIVDGQCRHVPRYEKKLRFGLLYSGTADGAYLNRWMDRVMLNFGGENLGVHPMGDAGEVLKYFIAVSTSQAADGFEEYTVPVATWAIFPGSGTGVSIQKLEERIITEWLPTSGYEYANGPDVEVYLSPDPQNAQYEVWIPVKKKP